MNKIKFKKEIKILNQIRKKEENTIKICNHFRSRYRYNKENKEPEALTAKCKSVSEKLENTSFKKPNHHPKFDVNEDCLLVAAKSLTDIALDRLQ